MGPPYGPSRYPVSVILLLGALLALSKSFFVIPERVAMTREISLDLRGGNASSDSELFIGSCSLSYFFEDVSYHATENGCDIHMEIAGR